jgi:hypothetical protein
MRGYAMNAKWNWQRGAVMILCLVTAGCREHSAQRSALGEEMGREMRLATPTVGGPSREIVVEREPAKIAKAARSAMESSGVRLVQEGSTAQGQWLLGKSLADRSVLVEILPIYPGRSTVKITVEGADALTRELLSRLHTDIKNKVR